MQCVPSVRGGLETIAGSADLFDGPAMLQVRHKVAWERTFSVSFDVLDMGVDDELEASIGIVEVWTICHGRVSVVVDALQHKSVRLGRDGVASHDVLLSFD